MALPRLASVLSGAHLPRLHPDQPLDVALRQMADWPLLPVVHGADFRRLEGAISLGDILSTYRRVHPRGYDGGAGSATGRTK